LVVVEALRIERAVDRAQLGDPMHAVVERRAQASKTRLG
jgi:hypothetical protein